MAQVNVRNLDQIQGSLAGDLERIEGGHDAQLIAFVVDHADFADTNTVIGADKTLIDTVLRTNFYQPKYSTLRQ